MKYIITVRYKCKIMGVDEITYLDFEGIPEIEVAATIATIMRIRNITSITIAPEITIHEP